MENARIDRRLLLIRLVFNRLDPMWKALNPVRLDVLLHVVALNEPPATVWTLVRFVPAVDLPVPVQAARVGQLLPANLASHRRLPVRANLTGFDAADRVFLRLWCVLRVEAASDGRRTLLASVQRRPSHARPKVLAKRSLQSPVLVTILQLSQSSLHLVKRIFSHLSWHAGVEL